MLPQVNQILDTIREKLSGVSHEATLALVNEICIAPRVFFAGAGRSKLVANMFAMRLMHCGHYVHIVGDVTTPAIGKEDLMIIVSGSGETSQLIQFATRLEAIQSHREKPRVAVITAKSNSTLSLLADTKVVLEPENKEAENCLPLGGRFELAALVYLEAVIIELMRKLSLSESDLRARHTNLE